MKQTSNQAPTALLIEDGDPDRFDVVLSHNPLPPGTKVHRAGDVEEARRILEGDDGDGIFFIGYRTGIFAREEGLSRINGRAPRHPNYHDHGATPMVPQSSRRLIV